VSEGLKDLLKEQLLLDDDPEISNLRDITDLLLFDPRDPVDYGAAGLAASGVGALPAAGVILGNRLRKLNKLLKGAKTITVPLDASINPRKDKMRKAGNYIKYQMIGENVVKPIADKSEELITGVDGMAKGGLADLPVQHAFLGGLKRFYEAGKEGYKLYKKQKKKKKAEDKDDKKDTKKETKTDGEDAITENKEKSSLLFSPRGDAKRVGEISSNILANELVRSAIRNSLRLGVYGGGAGLGYYGLKKGYDALFGEDEKETKTDREDTIGDPIEPKTFLEKLRDMDPALARALIAGGAKMLQPTEGPVRSFLGLGEFGEGFSESLAQSEAGKSDTQQLYEAYLASVPEGQAPLDIVRFANSLKQDSEDFKNQESRLLAYLQNNAGGDKLTLSDFAVEKEDLAAIGIDYQGEKDPSVDELLIRYSGPERESVINLIVSKSYVKD
jgi:hypothetical protein